MTGSPTNEVIRLAAKSFLHLAAGMKNTEHQSPAGVLDCGTATPINRADLDRSLADIIIAIVNDTVR
jgi:hypothetical protein